jgi:aryl-alcohol dehydrogenase-like predicted oxidoreductase
VVSRVTATGTSLAVVATAPPEVEGALRTTDKDAEVKHCRRGPRRWRWRPQLSAQNLTLRARVAGGAGTPCLALKFDAFSQCEETPFWAMGLELASAPVTPSRMKRRVLGSAGLTVSAQGLGCMGMSAFYGSRDDVESLATLDLALERGVTLLDTAEMYGPYTNEELLGRALEGRRQKVELATKFGIVPNPTDPTKRRVDGSRANVRRSIDASLKRLRTDVIDLYYLHRVDPSTPIEDTVGAMAELVQAGKVRFLGLSEVGPQTLERAHRVHPIAAVQSEYSLWSRDPEDGVLAACRRLGIGFVAYSPLGRGFLTGQLKRFEDLAADDYRRTSPRFQGDNFARNLQLVERLTELAAQKGCTPSQLALAWVSAQGEDIVPIPGTKRRAFLEENVGAEGVRLSEVELARLAELAPKDVASGQRYPAAMMASIAP